MPARSRRRASPRTCACSGCSATFTTLLPASAKRVVVIGCGAGVTAGAVSIDPDDDDAFGAGGQERDEIVEHPLQAHVLGLAQHLDLAGIVIIEHAVRHLGHGDRCRMPSSLSVIVSPGRCASALLKPGPMHFPSLFEEDGITPKRITSFELSEPIRSEIESIKELERLFQSPMHTLSSAGQLSSWHIAQASIHRLFAGAAPEVIISDLLDLARRDVCDNSMYIGLYGGGVSDKVELDENVAVMPAGAAPPSYARELIFGIDRWGRPLPHNGLPTGNRMSLSLYLRKRLFFQQKRNSILLECDPSKRKRREQFER